MRSKKCATLILVATAVFSIPGFAFSADGSAEEHFKKRVPCFIFDDPIHYGTINVCGYNYTHPAADRISFHNSAVDSFLLNSQFVDRKAASTRIVDATGTYDVFIPRGLKENSSIAEYSVGVFSPIASEDFQLASSKSITYTLSTTTGDSSDLKWSASMNTRIGGALLGVDFAGELGAASSHYVTTTESVSKTSVFTPQTIDGDSFPWRIEKYGVYFPIKIEKLRNCSEDASLCGGSQRGSYVERISYKLVLVTDPETILSYRVSTGVYSTYYMQTSVPGGPLLLEDIQAVRGFPHVRYHQQL